MGKRIGVQGCRTETKREKDHTHRKKKKKQIRKTATPTPDLLIKPASYLWYVVLGIIKPLCADCTAVASLQFKSKSR